jgi:hypothetical protein
MREEFMSIYFDFKSINELTGNNYHRQPEDEVVDLLSKSRFIGKPIDDEERNLKSILPSNRQIQQDTTKFTPDDWIRYITPLVTYALREPTQGMNAQRSYQKFILLGVLVGLGKTPQDAINQLEEWQNTGASQILKGGTSTTNSGTSGSVGTPGSPSIGSSGGTVGGTGIGSTSSPGIGSGIGTNSNTNISDRLNLD